MEKKQRDFSVWYFIITFLIILGIQNYLATRHVETISYSEFKSLVKKGLVSDLVIGEQSIRGTIKGEGLKEVLEPDKLKTLDAETKAGKKGYPFVVVRVDDPNLAAELEQAKISFRGEIVSTWLPTLLSWVVPVALFFLLWTYLLRKMGPGSGLMQIGKSKAKVYIEKKTGVTFADVEGIDEAEQELMEVVEFLKTPQKYQRLGGRIPKGVLLVGPPGTGKTLLARAVAGEAGVPFFSMSGSEFVEVLVGVGASRVRDLFDQAKKAAPSIIFIDEIDAVGRQRGMSINSNDEREQTLNQLLVEMDGFDTNQAVVVLAATNRPDGLDIALLRPGRFDRRVTVDRPDRNGRLAILKIHSRNIPLAPDVDLTQLSRSTTGMVGADLANMVNE